VLGHGARLKNNTLLMSEGGRQTNSGTGKTHGKIHSTWGREVEELPIKKEKKIGLSVSRPERTGIGFTTVQTARRT